MFEARIKLYQQIIRSINIISCLIAFFGSLYLTQAYPFISSQHCLIYTNIHHISFYTASILSIIFTHLFYFTAASTYARIYFLPGILKQITSSFLILCVDCILFYIYQFIFLVETLSAYFYIYYCLSSLILIILARISLTYFIKLYTEKCSRQLHFLILGANKRSYDYSMFIRENAFLGFQVIGFLDDADYSGQHLSLIGPLEDFDRVLRENVIDRCVVFLPIRSSYDRIMRIIDRAENQGIALQLMANMFQRTYGYVSPSIMGSFFGILYDSMPLDDWRLTVKRGFDILAALILLTLTLPLMALVAVLTKLADGGPIFFAQQRVGYRKRLFKMYKFRSMVMDAEGRQIDLEGQNEMTGPVFKIKNDPRVTPLGRLIRKYSIDELPQLVNVVLGDMSIVGPRPMAQRDYAGFAEDWLRRRFSVRPGLTCLWQCQKNRNDLAFEDWMRLDMEYIDRWSLTEDLKICLKTVVVVLMGNGR